MYLPKNNDQMAEILVDLITYARASGQADLAECLSDALVTLTVRVQRLATQAESRAATKDQPT